MTVYNYTTGHVVVSQYWNQLTALTVYSVLLCHSTSASRGKGVSSKSSPVFYFIVTFL